MKRGRTGGVGLFLVTTEDWHIYKYLRDARVKPQVGILHAEKEEEVEKEERLEYPGELC